MMGRLRRDVRGNTLAILAISLIPVSALIGSGIDTARLYVVKVRLQQACDAGALAGRKAMASSNATTLDANATTQANTFFDNIFKSGWMRVGAFSNAYSKTTDQQVAGVASATVPMTIMKMFSAPDVTLNVTCEARYDVADTDIMFVLDTTGSMACTTASDPCGAAPVSYSRPDGTTGFKATEQSGSKIQGLRDAVLNFYDTVAANADPSTHIRYGFVPYTSTVNAGEALYKLSPSNIVDSWNYESRRVVGDDKNGGSSSNTQTGVLQVPCAAMAGRSPAVGYDNNGRATVITTTWSANSGGTCNITQQPMKPMWRYQQVTYDTSLYKQTVISGTVTDPSKISGATSKWQGCIEERDTTATSTFNSNSLPPDLDPDLPATSDATKWRPMWPEVVFYRGATTSADSSGDSTTPYGDYRPKVKTPVGTDPYTDGATTSYTSFRIYPGNNWASNLSGGYVSCGKPVQRLATLTRSEVSNYVNAADFVPQGGTYHDTGMIWGTRMISPTGIFAGDTAAWPGRNAPNRYIVFMTDGQMAPNYSVYGMYGMEYYDRRVTGANLSTANDTDYHNARFLAECAAAKARNIKVFVIGFGQTLTNELKTCASDGKAYYASDNKGLDDVFQEIAQQIALLRISQ